MLQLYEVYYYFHSCATLLYVLHTATNVVHYFIVAKYRPLLKKEKNKREIACNKNENQLLL